MYILSSPSTKEAEKHKQHKPIPRRPGSADILHLPLHCDVEWAPKPDILTWYHSLPHASLELLWRQALDLWHASKWRQERDWHLIQPLSQAKMDAVGQTLPGCFSMPWKCSTAKLVGLLSRLIPLEPSENLPWKCLISPSLWHQGILIYLKLLI